MNWYYDLGGQRQGPVAEAELDRLLAAGTITTSTLVWCEGMENWTPMKDARPDAGGAPATAGADVPEGWIRCAATGRYFPPSQIVWLDGKAYSAEAKAGVVQGVMQGGELPSGDESLRTGPAWEQRAQLGFFKALWETIKAVLLDPNRTFETMKRDGGYGAPLGFYMTLVATVSVVGLIFNLLFGEAIRSLMSELMPAQPNPVAPVFKPGVAYYLGGSLLTPLLMLIGSFVASGIVHLSLMICSGAKMPFETTYRTHNYAMGAGFAVALIPLCGGLIGAVWGIVCLCLGLARTHEINTGRAVGAVAISAALTVCLCCVFYMIFGVFIFASIAAATGAAAAHH